MRVNHARSRIRARIEHVFGAQQNAPGGRIVRTIGTVRARAKIGLQNLAYNIRRLVTLERLALQDGGVVSQCSNRSSGRKKKPGRLATTWLSSWRADACPTSAVLNSRLKMCGRVRRQVQPALTKRGDGDIARLSSLTAFTPMRCILLMIPTGPMPKRQLTKGSCTDSPVPRPLSPRHFPVRASRRTLARDGHRDGFPLVGPRTRPGENSLPRDRA